jgi:hypothetical protein
LCGAHRRMSYASHAYDLSRSPAKRPIVASSGPVAAVRRSHRRVVRGIRMDKLLGRYPRLALFAVIVASFVLAGGAGRKWH